jgi:putative transcriptional regulator
MRHPPLPFLLTAGAVLADPNFSKAVVLLLEWNEEGAFGLILNRPTDLAVEDHLPEWAHVVERPAVVHVGGPVQREVAIGLDVTRGQVPSLIDLSSPEAGHCEALRVFAGYSGWGARQLEAELGSDAWHLTGWRPEDLRPGVGDDLWRRVMRRQPGTVAFESTFPDDLSVN